MTLHGHHEHLHPNEVDITGRRFTRLVALCKAVSGKHGVSSKWKFACDCGNIVIIKKSSVLSGKTRSCGCLRKKFGELVAQKFNRADTTVLAKDITGRRFGMLMVKERAPPEEHRKKQGSYWRCQCRCGNTTTVRGSLLRLGQTKSCGCARGKSRISKLPAIKAGDVYGKLTILSQARSHTRGQGHNWKCRCACGARHVARQKDLRMGTTTSCGCARSPIGRKSSKLNGMRMTPFLRSAVTHAKYGIEARYGVRNEARTRAPDTKSGPNDK